jgi:hypothetical protein
MLCEPQDNSDNIACTRMNYDINNGVLIDAQQIQDLSRNLFSISDDRSIEVVPAQVNHYRVRIINFEQFVLQVVSTIVQIPQISSPLANIQSNPNPLALLAEVAATENQDPNLQLVSHNYDNVQYFRRRSLPIPLPTAIYVNTSKHTNMIKSASNSCPAAFNNDQLTSVKTGNVAHLWSSSPQKVLNSQVC